MSRNTGKLNSAIPVKWVATLWLVILSSEQAMAISLRDALAIAVESNPQIGKAIENRKAVAFELQQAQGLYFPRIDLEASSGLRHLDSPARRAASTDDDTLYPNEVNLTLTQTLYDGYDRRGEIEHQAARVDAASFRALERTEFIALQVARVYFEILLQQKITAANKRNVGFHRRALSRIRTAVREGALTAADSQQAQERLHAARARLRQAELDLATAKINFLKLVGVPVNKTSFPKAVSPYLPKTLEAAIATARHNNPRIKLASADVDAAAALVRRAKGRYYPKISLEGQARTGSDLDGIEGRTTDFRGRVVLRWNLFNGGIDKANIEEQIHRDSEQRMVLRNVHREVEEAVRISWARKTQEARLTNTLRSQYRTARSVVASYQAQFDVGQRSLLDLLDSQDTAHNTLVLLEIAKFSNYFANYRILAATSRLLDTFNIQAPEQAKSHARKRYRIAPTQSGDAR